MKKIALISAVLLISQISFAQFSSSIGNSTTGDKVGIQTSTPATQLEIFNNIESKRAGECRPVYKFVTAFPNS